MNEMPTRRARLEPYQVAADIEHTEGQTLALIKITQCSTDGRFVEDILLTPDEAIRLAAELDTTARKVLSALTIFEEF